jgi:uncharacterized membrane protein YqgA involved in biofilm formation
MEMILGIVNLALGIVNLLIAIKKEKEGKEAPINWIAAYLGMVVGACLIITQNLDECN